MDIVTSQANATNATNAVNAVTITEWNALNSMMTKKATDIMASPLITDGYQRSGKPASLAFVHLNTMAESRVKKAFPNMDKTDPVFARLIAEAKLIVAKCMLLKYQCRERRQAYDHLRDADVQVRHMIKTKLDAYTAQVARLSHD